MVNMQVPQNVFTKLTISSWLLDQIVWGLHWLVEPSHRSHELLHTTFFPQHTVNTQMQIISWLINVFKTSRIIIQNFANYIRAYSCIIISNLENCTPSCFTAHFYHGKTCLIWANITYLLISYWHILCKLAEYSHIY